MLLLNTIFILTMNSICIMFSLYLIFAPILFTSLILLPLQIVILSLTLKIALCMATIPWTRLVKLSSFVACTYSYPSLPTPNYDTYFNQINTINKDNCNLWHKNLGHPSKYTITNSSKITSRSPNVTTTPSLLRKYTRITKPHSYLENYQCALLIGKNFHSSCNKANICYHISNYVNYDYLSSAHKKLF